MITGNHRSLVVVVIFVAIAAAYMLLNKGTVSQSHSVRWQQDQGGLDDASAEHEVATGIGSLLSPRAKRNTHWDPPRGRDVIISINSGTLTDAIVRHLEMSAEERASAQAVVTQTFDKVRETARSRMKIDVLRNDPDKGIYAYKIPPFPEEGAQILREMRDQLMAVLGKDRGAVVADSFAYNNYYGSFGQRDVFLEFAKRSNVIMVARRDSDAKTGGTLREVTHHLETFEKLFGQLVDTSKLFE